MSRVQKKKIFMAMSGGVDSSVAALLLRKATPNNFKKLFGRPTPKGFRGYDVVGVYIKGWSLTGCAENDARDARRVAGALNISFYVFNFEDEYKNSVVDYMVSEYGSGVTPNPDVMCNKEIKFGLFLEKALKLGADYIATGHYARLIKNNHFTSIAAAKDVNKDQSYFLWTLAQKQLKHCLFPIGEYTKPQVRALAKKYKLPTAEKPDSQGVCFVGEIDVAGFLKEKLGKNPGPIKTIDGKTIGTHDGAIFYTIGQRKGIGIKGSLPGEQGKVYYVAAKDVDTNTLWVAEGESQKLFSKELIVKDINWISGKQPRLPLKCLVRIRYRQPLQQASLVEFSNKSKNKKQKIKILKVTFNTSQRAITPGQSAVFYNKTGTMLGGGVIV